jgi:hypothetical protein
LSKKNAPALLRGLRRTPAHARSNSPNGYSLPGTWWTWVVLEYPLQSDGESCLSQPGSEPTPHDNFWQASWHYPVPDSASRCLFGPYWPPGLRTFRGAPAGGVGTNSGLCSEWRFLTDPKHRSVRYGQGRAQERTPPKRLRMAPLRPNVAPYGNPSTRSEEPGFGPMGHPLPTLRVLASSCVLPPGTPENRPHRIAPARTRCIGSYLETRLTTERRESVPETPLAGGRLQRSRRARAGVKYEPHGREGGFLPARRAAVVLPGEHRHVTLLQFLPPDSDLAQVSPEFGSRRRQCVLLVDRIPSRPWPQTQL